MYRRQFLKNAWIFVLGSLTFPDSVSAAPKKTLTEKIIQVESEWNPNAYRKNTKATGLMQIRPVVLEEWNMLNPNRKYSMKDLFKPDVNINIGQWYLRSRIENYYLPRYNLKAHLENILAAWNMGPTKLGSDIGDAKKNFHKLPSETKKFIQEVKKA